mmetsp:Transcript_41110/g.118266  ORF Transcript_41110/g.118266 Transcript_41110/m.118266 type:complete len:283 (-) Transcript_41110:118-966(-)
MIASKRAAPPMTGSVAEPMKLPRTDGLNAEGAWRCGQCGNMNFKGRMYCNMRKCGAPGPWTCPACGNENFANRAVCNMRTCGQPRPANPNAPAGGAFMAGPTFMPSAGPAPIRPQQAQAALQAVALLQASGLANMPGIAEGISKITQTALAPGFSGGCGVGPLSADSAWNAAEVGAAPKPAPAPIDGSWVCVDCGNINYPNRTVCNAKMCQRPREEVDGGPPKAGANMRSIYFPNSWVCSACNNVNWPQRESCGMRKCGRPRAEVDAGPPAPPTMDNQVGAG